MTKAQTLPVIFVEEGALAKAGLPDGHAAWAKANGFSGQRGKLLALPGADGAVAGYLFGTGEAAERSALVAGLAGAALGEGEYRLEGAYGDATLAALGFRLGTYRFDRYRKGKSAPILAVPDAADAGEVDPPDRGGVPGSRSHQHPAQRSGARRFRARNPRLRHRPQYELQGHRRRRVAGRQFPHDPRRRPRQHRSAAPDRHELGQ